jgi:hypothetical protein
MDAFTRAYITAALWSSTDDADESGGAPLDRNYSADDLAPETLAKIEADCAAFQAKAGELIADDEPKLYQDNTRDEHAGHDFWLTRNGHGCGFWDGDWPKHGDALTEIAKGFGGCGLYVGDDGRIYSFPG